MMVSAKEIVVKPISAKDAVNIVKRIHYSGKVVMGSQLHFGVFLDGRLEGAMQFGPSLDKRNTGRLVEQTGWNDFIELNRMAFSDRLPRNSESRAIAIAMRIIRKQYPHIEWVISFSDGTQCGDGTIYRASGFDLIGIKKNKTIWVFPDGERVADLSIKQATDWQKKRFGRIIHGTAALHEAKRMGAAPLPGFQLRYIYFLNPKARQRLTVPILPFSKIEEMGAGMYLGQARGKDQASAHPAELGGETPTPTLQPSKPSE
jgi:hypothetical protein